MIRGMHSYLVAASHHPLLVPGLLPGVDGLGGLVGRGEADRVGLRLDENKHCKKGIGIGPI